MKVAQSLRKGNGYFGLDANDVEVEGEWRTLEYQLVNYTNFKPAPDNYLGREDHAIFCASCPSGQSDGFLGYGPGNWNDVKPDFIVEHICEKDAQASTTSGTLKPST